MISENVYVGRQPILNANHELMAYELLFRSESGNYADVKDALFATARVLVNTVNSIGIRKLLGDVQGYINVDDVILKKGVLKMLPKDKFMMEILENTQVDAELLEVVAAMKEEGFTFGLDDFVFKPETIKYFEALFPYISVVKVDLKTNTPESVKSRMEIFKPYKLELLAEKVENMEEFKQYKAMGFQLFQGYFFEKPTIIKGKNIDPNRLAIFELINQIYQDNDIAELEKTLKNYPELTINLLQFINSAAIALKNRITSVRQALALLGHKQLLNWLLLLSYASPKAGYTGNPLLFTAIERAKTMELLLRKVMSQSNTAMYEEAFLIGLLSLLDALFQSPMEDILNELNMGSEISEAIIGYKGILGKLLLLVKKAEENDVDALSEILKELKLSMSEFTNVSLEGFCWAQTSGKQVCVKSE